MHNAQDFANSFSSANNTYYVFAGRHYPFVGGDANVSQPSGSYSNENFNLYQDMIFGKKVNSTDVKMTIRRIDWVSGTVYDKYNNNDALLMDKNFYVGVTSGSYYDVFKCLDNNFEGPSTSVPTKADTSELVDLKEKFDAMHFNIESRSVQRQGPEHRRMGLSREHHETRRGEAFGPHRQRFRGTVWDPPD